MYVCMYVCMYVMFCTMQPQILRTLSACPVAGNHPYGATGKEGKIKEVVKDRRCDEDGKVPVGLSGPLIFFPSAAFNRG